MKADDVYQKLTDEILARIEAGTPTWEMPWYQLANNAGPVSMSSNKPYQGVNWWVLGLAQLEKGYRSNRWATFNWWKDHGGSVRKGEKATWIVKVGTFTPKGQPEGEDPKRKPFLKAYFVFNADQVEGYEHLGTPTPELTDHERHEAAEAYFAAIGADVRVGGDQAYWHSSADYIAVPPLNQFKEADFYYGTLAHEHVHWTGPEHRLDRRKALAERFKDDAYAFEELIAELGAAFIGAQLQLSPTVRREHTEPYLAHWVSVMKADKKAFGHAASKAQAAVAYLNDKAGVELAESKELEPA